MDTLVSHRTVAIEYRSISVKVEVKSLSEEADLRLSGWVKTAAVRDTKVAAMDCEKLLAIEDGDFELPSVALHEQLFQQALLQTCFC